MRGHHIAIAGRNGETRSFDAETGWPRPMIETVARRVHGWLERFRQRRALDLLDDRMLRDIGVTRFDAEREIRKPFWLA